MNKELALYKLIMIPDEPNEDIQYVEEIGWINDEQFCVWVNYTWLKNFINGLKKHLWKRTF